MKQWNEPKVEELCISATADPGHNKETGNGKECLFFPGEPCNAKGNGKGICNNCPLKLSIGSDTSVLS